MTTITFPTNTPDIINSIRDAIGRNVTFYIVGSSIPCPVCNLDPITNTSTNSFCVICNGNYWIPTLSGIDINAHITWGGVDNLGWATGGQYFTGDCRIQIEYTTSNNTTVNGATKVLVDGKNMKIQHKIYRGAQEINRIIVDLIEEEA